MIKRKQIKKKQTIFNYSSIYDKEMLNSKLVNS